MREENKDWLKLDNAAKIYPATSSKKSPSQFRLSVTLKSPVRFTYLQNAWKNMIQRCPYFRVYLERGFFWYYLQKHDDFPPLELLEEVPSSTFQYKQKYNHLIRIGVKGRKIALDFSHILTDGNGASRFLLALVFEYFRLTGLQIEKQSGLPYPDEQPDACEFEDSFLKYYPGDIPHPKPLSGAFHLQGKLVADHRFKTIRGKIPLDKLIITARNHKVSITEFLTAIYIYSLKSIYVRSLHFKKPSYSVIRLQVPVNMRNFHPSVTMRNFSLYVSPEIDLKLGDYSFDEILKRVHHTMKLEVDKKELGRQVSRNVGGELNPLVKFIPLFGKDIYLGSLYSKLGEKCFSGVLSNLGAISLPQNLQDHIETFDFTIYPNFVMKKSCAVLSYGNDLIVNFCSVIDQTDLERVFFTKLVDLDIPVSVKEI
jgi:hypothetical protein